MKKIIILLLLVAVVLVIVLVGNGNKLEGEWACTYYAIAGGMDNKVVEQDEDFYSEFKLLIYDDGVIGVSTYGNENKGVYTVNKDTLNIEIMKSSSQYLIEKNTLTLVNHPRAKIIYTKVGK